MPKSERRLPAGAVYAASSPQMTESTVLPPILRRHLAPRGKCGYLVVQSGSLEFVWEDTGEVMVADPGHPVVIAPERFHHVKVTGPVSFHIEFYTLPASPDAPAAEPDAERPGESFL